MEENELHSNLLKGSSDSLGFVDLNTETDEKHSLLSHIDPTPETLEYLTAQLRNQLDSGRGETFYEIGVEDNGYPRGLTEDQLAKSNETLKLMAKSLNAEAFCLCMREGKVGKIAVNLVRDYNNDRYLDIRIAVCGNVDAGKSTFIGVLTKGQLDNGRGLARSKIFNHKHEIETGRTSSIAQQILGFSADGECVNYIPSHGLTWGDIIEKSYKVISFIDLAGHEKYLKTTVSGMTGQIPDYCLLMVGANMGVTRMTKEHFGLALSLKIPVIIIITKIDIAPEKILKETLNDVLQILKMRGIRKMPLLIKTDDDFINAVKSIQNDRIVPIFLVSNVTGETLDRVRSFLNAIPPRIEWDSLKDKDPEILIDQTYYVTGVGTVVGGTVMSGTVHSGQTMLLGPDGNGAFNPVQIKSIHSQRVLVKKVSAGMSASLALKKIKRSAIRKGLVLVSPESKPKATYFFESDVIVLYHSTTIHKNYQPVVQCLTIRQSAKIVHIMNKEVLRTGDKAKVIFKFMYRPEFLKEGMRVIFREGRCKGIGIISRVCIPEVEVRRLAEEQKKEEEEKEKQNGGNDEIVIVEEKKKPSKGFVTKKSFLNK